MRLKKTKVGLGGWREETNVVTLTCQMTWKVTERQEKKMEIAYTWKRTYDMPLGVLKDEKNQNKTNTLKMMMKWKKKEERTVAE